MSKLRAKFELETLSNGVFHLEDRSNSTGSTSITNDAENVIAWLHKNFDLKGKKVQYRDTDGQVDRLLHDDEGHFVRFAAGPWN